jgi:hypothetical protein
MLFDDLRKDKKRSMSELATTRPANMERIAWTVLALSFALFCSITVTGTMAVYAFLFESSLPMEAIVQVGRGTAVITSSDFSGRGVRFQEDITGRTATISTDSQSQSTLLFRLGDADRTLFASVNLKNSTDVRLLWATFPRFSWSRQVYSVGLRDFRGKADVLVLTSQPLVLDFQTARGEQIYLTRRGRYTIEASDTRVRVVTYEGEAAILGLSQANNRLVVKGQEGVLFVGRAEPVVSPSRPNLLENSLFVLDDFLQEQPNALPERWGCTNAQDAPPRGAYQVNAWEGWRGLRLTRAENANSHGETRCQQRFSEVGLDVSGYTYLQLEATFLIHYQSLSDCGIRGSECPMMLRIAYEDVNGARQEWIQGFYYATNPSVNYPQRCETCLQDHRQINEKVWYSYETGNLFSIIPTSSRPVRIMSVEFYASGHQYDVFVSDLALFGGYVDAVPDVSGQ